MINVDAVGSDIRPEMVKLLEQRGDMTTEDVEMYFGRHRHLIRKHLDKLHREGKIEKRLVPKYTEDGHRRWKTVVAVWCVKKKRFGRKR